MADRSQRLAIIVVAQDMASKTLRGINGELARMAGGRGPMAQVTHGAATTAAGLGRLGVAAAAAAIGGLAAASKAGIDFEDAFAGARRTIAEDFPGQLDAIGAALRELAREIPVTASELARIAEIGGAVGVPTEDILTFTEAVARMGAATSGLNVDEAADAFGRFGNILGIHGPDIDRMASAIIELGNSGASTAQDIIDVTRRFGPMGRQVGLTTADILGYSSAIASMGPLNEAAGSSLTRLFGNLTTYAATGDKKFAAFASAAGRDMGEFAEVVRTDVNGAMLAVLKSLSQMDTFEAMRALKAMGITQVRDRQAVLALAQSYPELTRQIDASNDAFAKGTALQQVSDIRYRSLRNLLKLLGNEFVEAGLKISEQMNPAIGRAVERLREFMKLPGTGDDLRNLGRDIAEGIDQINWKRVIDGAKTLVDAMKMVLDVVRMLPPELIAGGVGFAAVNKISGGLIGKGLGDILGGTLRAGIGQLLGRGSAANPMWVRMVGGLGGVAGAGAGATGLFGKVASVAGAGLALVGVFDTWADQNAQSTAQATEIQARQEQWLSEQPSRADLERGLSAIDTGIAEIRSNPLNVLVQGDALNKLEAMRAQIIAQIGATNSLKPYLVSIAQAAANGQQTINYIAGERAQSGTGSIGGARNSRSTRGVTAPTPRVGIERNRGTVLQVQTSISARESHNATVTWSRYGGGHPVGID